MTTGMLNAPQEGVPGEGPFNILSGSPKRIYRPWPKNVKEPSHNWRYSPPSSPVADCAHGSMNSRRGWVVWFRRRLPHPPFQGRPKTHPFQSENHARWNEIHISEINLIDRFIPLWLNWTQTKNTRQSTMYFRQLNFWENTILYIITMPLPCLLFDWSNKIA